jgi:hypothetical protein
MDVPCPKSNSTVLQKVPLACEEVPYRRDKRTYLHRILVETGGPGVLVGVSTTNITRQLKLTAQSGGMATGRICENTSAHLLSSETFIVQIPFATAASNSLLAARQQNRVPGRTFRAES